MYNLKSCSVSLHATDQNHTLHTMVPKRLQVKDRIGINFMDGPPRTGPRVIRKAKQNSKRATKLKEHRVWRRHRRLNERMDTAKAYDVLQRSCVYETKRCTMTLYPNENVYF